VLPIELAVYYDIETTNLFYSIFDEEHLKAAVKFDDELLMTDLKLTFSAISRQNKYIDNFSKSLLLLSL
jgi:hypothetical protein